MLQLLYHSSYPIIYISFELMQQKKNTNTYISLTAIIEDSSRTFQVSRIKKKHTLSYLYHQSFRSSKKDSFPRTFWKSKNRNPKKRKEKKKTTLLTFKNLLVPTRWIKGGPFNVTNKFNQITNRIATRSKDPRLLLFLLSAENRCAPLNDARRHLCDGKLTPRWKRWKAGKSYLFRRVAKKESWPGHKNFET